MSGILTRRDINTQKASTSRNRLPVEGAFSRVEITISEDESDRSDIEDPQAFERNCILQLLALLT
jgi:hypothetical protein